jgi:hypothetical protein
MLARAPDREAHPFWLRLASLAVGTFLAFVLLAVFSFSYVRYCKARGISIGPLRRHRIVRRALEDQAYRDLKWAVTHGHIERFPTLWDHDLSIALSKDEFVPVTIYGQTSYRYRSNIKILNVVVWTGLEPAGMAPVATPEIREILKRCQVLHEITFETDANGFKKTEFVAEPGTPTVLFVGDSLTEGLYTASEQTFVNLFGRKMRGAGIRAAPINAGVNGYGVPEERWTVEQYALPAGSRVVIENLFPNDVYSDVAEVIAGERSLRRHYREMLDHLEDMWGYCQRNGIILIVAAIPAKEQLAGPPIESPFEKRVRAWCAERNIHYVSPLPLFRTLGKDEVYLSWDPHLSTKGHEHYASFLFTELRPELLRAFAASP